MALFRGYIAKDEKDYREKEQIVHKYLKVFTPKYNSKFYAGADGYADIYSIKWEPILLEPKDLEWSKELEKLTFKFTDLDDSIIMVYEDPEEADAGDLEKGKDPKAPKEVKDPK